MTYVAYPVRKQKCPKCKENMRRLRYKQPPYYYCNICKIGFTLINKKLVNVKMKNLINFRSKLKGSNIIEEYRGYGVSNGY